MPRYSSVDGLSFYYRFLVGAPGENMLKRGVLQFCGVTPVRVTQFDWIRFRNQAWLDRALQRAASIGHRDAVVLKQ